MYEYIYAIVPADTNKFKIGRWSGEISALRSRYATYYGSWHFDQTANGNSPLLELGLGNACAQHHFSNEIYYKEGLPIFLDHAQSYCLKACKSRDFDARISRIKTKRVKAQDETLKKVQDELTSTKNELKKEQEEHRSTKRSLKQEQKEHRSTQSDLKKAQEEIAQRAIPKPSRTEDGAKAAEDWISANMVQCLGKRIHLHRIARANEGIILSSSVVIAVLTAQGYRTSEVGMNAKDSRCCPSVCRYVINANVIGE